MRNIIVGTAGHIDHGKTSLVKALTGTDADRLAEEKRRGITIDLGFAHLQLSKELRLGFIDVPGHERFVRNMLAGAAGIDMVLFVVAADESIKPQTREHFEICRLLGVQAGVIALTKADRAEPDLIGLVRMEVDELASGSFLEKAPRIAVSSVTGEGLPELRAALEKTALAVREKRAGGFFRLPIDRSFTMKGFGTVVTGTLVSGTLPKEQEVELYPTGRRLRVRGLQVYGEHADRARAGQRTAVNLAGIEAGEISRGMVLSEAGRFTPVKVFDARLEMLPTAKALKNNAPIHLHLGAASIEAEVRFPAKRNGFVRIVMREPALVLPGDRFIVRMFSPVVTIGGGVVVDIVGRRFDAARAEALFHADSKTRVAMLIEERKFGLARSELVAITGTDEVPAGEWLIAPSRVEELRRALVARVRQFHKEHTLLPGIPKQDLRGDMPAETFNQVLASATPEVVQDGEVVRLASHRVVLKVDEEQARAAMERAFEAAGLTAPAVAEVLKASGLEPARAKSILQILLREGRLLRVSDELVLHASAGLRLRAEMAGRKGQRFAVPAFKEWTGVSRKFAIPLLEYLDREKVTRREGDERVVL